MKVRKLQPMGDRVIVIPDKNEEVTTRSGIVLAVNNEDAPLTGTILEVGPGLDDKPLPENLKPGARIMYGKYSGSKIDMFLAKQDEIDKPTEVLVMRVGDLIGVIVDEE